MLRALAHLALFVTGLGGTAALVHRVDAMPYRDWTRPKVVHWRDHAADYDTVVLGSSRLHFGFQPAEFDARMRELGLPTRTFNLAFSGMRPHDYHELGRYVLDHRPPGLRRVVVELMDWDPGQIGTNWLSDLQLQAHPPRQLSHRLHSVMLNNPDFGDRLAKGHFAVMHTLANALAVGQGPRLCDDWLRATRGEALRGAYPVADEGFKDVAIDPWPANRQAHEDMLANPAAVDATLQQKRSMKFPPNCAPGFNLPAWEAFDRACREAGVEPTYVVMPSLGFLFPGRGGVADVMPRAIVLDLDDVVAHPTVFERSLWYDRSHLNDRGAKFLGRYLAECLAPRLRELATRPR
jgi:hypothetical protein